MSEKFPLSLRATYGKRKVNIMRITGKKGGEFGAGGGKRMTTGVLFYFELPFQRNRNCDWSPTCQSVNNKNISVAKESNFTAGFCSTWQTDTFCKLHSSFQWKPRSSRNLDYILGQNISSFHTIGIPVRDNERTISNSLPGL